MEHAFHLLLLLAATRLLGELFERVGQPASMGEVSAGVVLALVAVSPLSIPAIDNLPTSPFLEVAAEYGIFFIVLLAVMEMRPREIMSDAVGSLSVAIGGALLPLTSGFVLAWAFLPETPLKFAQAMLIGVALSISAVPVAVKVLMEQRLLHERVGKTIISAAIFDDLIGLFLLAVVLSVMETGAAPETTVLLVLLGKVSAFFIVSIAVPHGALANRLEIGRFGP